MLLCVDTGCNGQSKATNTIEVFQLESPAHREPQGLPVAALGQRSSPALSQCWALLPSQLLQARIFCHPVTAVGPLGHFLAFCLVALLFGSNSLLPLTMESHPAGPEGK